MSFSTKALRFTFSGAQSGSFSAAGLRAAVNIQAFPGRHGSVAQVPSLRGGIQVDLFNLVIEAGDLGGTLSEALNGPIFSSWIDLTSAPESAFNVTMIDVHEAATPRASQSQPGAQKAEDLIANVCAAAGLTFDNTGGASAVLNNQITYGSSIDQIAHIAHAAGFNWKKDGKKISIWPQNAPVDDTIIEIGPNTNPRMIGYPGWWAAGLVARSLYNPRIQIGRRMKVVGSSIPNANGLWQINLVQHDLTTMLPKGPWFSTAQLVAI
jgi:hypothetical protein